MLALFRKYGGGRFCNEDVLLMLDFALKDVMTEHTVAVRLLSRFGTSALGSASLGGTTQRLPYAYGKR